MAEGVLGEIVRRKRADVAKRLAGAPAEAPPSSRSLREALARPGARFIMEVKKASPSGHRSTVSVADAADGYAPVADAISVLTDAPFFGGSIEDLRTVRARFDGPILAKDFIVDPVQVAEARAHGADAVLAILAILSDAEAADLLAEARRLAMDVVVEVHDETELRRALALGASIIGINNRDLKTLRTDLATTLRLAPLVPPGPLVISESGIAVKADVDRLAPLVDGFLVGSSLMSADDVVQAARRLVFGSVKICGLTRAGDVRAAAAAGATHAGFIFVPGTPRVASHAVRELAGEAAALGLRSVGVFRDQLIAEVADAVHGLGLDAVQLHGQEQDILEFRAALPPRCEIWAVSAVSDCAEPSRKGADRTLFDTRLGAASGGTGVAFDWSLIADRPELASGFLAGGICSDNARAAQRLGAYGLDVGSKVESAPGQKDAQKLQWLFRALRPDCRESRTCS